jgi:hypothetical protein
MCMIPEHVCSCLSDLLFFKILCKSLLKLRHVKRTSGCTFSVKIACAIYELFGTSGSAHR